MPKGYNMFARGTAPRHQCSFERLRNPLCQLHNITTVYQCTICEDYHVCNGGRDCLMLNTGENMVCLLTGASILDNFQDSAFIPAQSLRVPEPTTDLGAVQNIIFNIQSDMARYFSQGEGLADVKEAIIDNGDLKPRVAHIIERTFLHCQNLLEEVDYGYDLICSMYTHIIISIYSTKTVYGPLLFKCTKNKRYDGVVKRIRQEWMSMLTTGDSWAKNTN